MVIHDNPDPDALASACALQRLAEEKAGIRSRICCEPIAGRAENRAMIRELRLNLLPVSRVNWGQWPLIALLDTQPGAGNNSFPPRRVPDIVIDHHPLRPKTRARFLDVRTDYGACATILAEYLRAASVAPPAALAAAMCYAISAETQDLVRPAPRRTRAPTCGSIRSRTSACSAASCTRGGCTAISPRSRARCSAPSRTGTSSAATWATSRTRTRSAWSPTCCCGMSGWAGASSRARWQGNLYVSLRAMPGRAHAGVVLARVLRKIGRAGGHGTMAAGRVPLKSPEPGERERLEKEIVLASPRPAPPDRSHAAAADQPRRTRRRAQAGNGRLVRRPEMTYISSPRVMSRAVRCALWLSAAKHLTP